MSNYLVKNVTSDTSNVEFGTAVGNITLTSGEFKLPDVTTISQNPPSWPSGYFTNDYYYGPGLVKNQYEVDLMTDNNIGVNGLNGSHIYQYSQKRGRYISDAYYQNTDTGLGVEALQYSRLQDTINGICYTFGPTTNVYISFDAEVLGMDSTVFPDGYNLTVKVQFKTNAQDNRPIIAYEELIPRTSPHMLRVSCKLPVECWNQEKRMLEIVYQFNQLRYNIQLAISKVQVELNEVTDFMPYEYRPSISPAKKGYLCLANSSSKNMLKLDNNTYLKSENCSYEYGNGGIEVTATGTTARVMYKIKAFMGMQYTLSFKGISSGNLNRVVINYSDSWATSGKKYFTISTSEETEYSYSFSPNIAYNHETYIYISMLVTNSSSSSGTMTIKDMQLEYGTSSTSYEIPGEINGFMVNIDDLAGTYDTNGFLKNVHYVSYSGGLITFKLVSSEGRTQEYVLEDAFGIKGTGNRIMSNQVSTAFSYKNVGHDDTMHFYVTEDGDIHVFIFDVSDYTIHSIQYVLSRISIVIYAEIEEPITIKKDSVQLLAYANHNYISASSYIEGVDVSYLYPTESAQKYLIQADTIIGITDKLREKLNITTPIEVTNIPNEILKLEKPLPAAEEASF